MGSLVNIMAIMFLSTMLVTRLGVMANGNYTPTTKHPKILEKPLITPPVVPPMKPIILSEPMTPGVVINTPKFRCSEGQKRGPNGDCHIEV